MPITRLIIENFKGIDSRFECEIKPITLFVGPNSSGKSSCIHALAVLGQTLKLPNNTDPIVLDDQNADVHLGRFIEVIHSKSYQDEITLGVEVVLSRHAPRWFSRHMKVGTTIRAEWSFRCSLRTQATRLERAKISIENREFSIKRRANGEFDVLDSKSGKKFLGRLLNAYFVSIPFPTGRSQSGDKETFESFELMEAAQWAVRTELSRVNYLGPFREPPARRYPTRGSSPSEVGPQGDATVTLLANESIRSQARPHTKQISGWLRNMGLANSVGVKRLGRSDLFDVNVTLTDNESLPIADLGYGLSQVLPVLAQCSFCTNEATLLFEQPELHLHQGAAARLARVFADAAKSKELAVIGETHSVDLFRETIRLVNQGDLSKNDVVAYDVERRDKASHFRKITLDQVGNGYEASHVWGRGLEQ